MNESEFVYIFDQLDQTGVDLLRRAASSNKLSLVNANDASMGTQDQSMNFLPFRFARDSSSESFWRGLLRTNCWSKVLYKCPLKNCVASFPNNYVDGFNGPTKIGRLCYKGAEILLLADFHGSEDNMCDRNARKSSAPTRGSSLRKPRMEEWVNKFVLASASERHCPVIDVVLEAMDAELETGAPYPLDKAVSHFSPCLEQRKTPGRCGKHRFHKIDIRHGTRFPTIGDFEVVIDSFYGRSSNSASRAHSIEVWKRIFNDLYPLYAGSMSASQVVQRILGREPQLVANLDRIADPAERDKLLRWITNKVADMPRSFSNLDASLSQVLSLYEADLSFNEFSKRAEALRNRPASSLMHAALYLSVLIVDYYALMCMLARYEETQSKPTHIVAYIGFHHFDNYVDYFGGDVEIVGRSGSDQRCETCASMSQPFLVPKHSARQITLMIPRSFAQAVIQAGSQAANSLVNTANRGAAAFAPDFDESYLSGAMAPYVPVSNVPSYGNFEILSYARPSKLLSASSSSSARLRPTRSSKKSRKSRSRQSTGKKTKSKKSRRKHKSSSSSSSSSESPRHVRKQVLRLVPRAASPLPYTLRTLSNPSQTHQVLSSVRINSTTSNLFRQAYPNLY